MRKINWPSLLLPVSALLGMVAGHLAFISGITIDGITPGEMEYIDWRLAAVWGILVIGASTVMMLLCLLIVGLVNKAKKHFEVRAHNKSR